MPACRKSIFAWAFALLLIIAKLGEVCGTCVWDSDFGFALNCQFRKSSMFRVRNLGGVKGYVGLGFSVGDELGFKQSLSNVEGNKRRSTGRSSQESSASGVAEDGSFVPPFRPLPAPVTAQSQAQAHVNGTTMRRYDPSTVSAFVALPQSIRNAAVSKTPLHFKQALQQATDIKTNMVSPKLHHRSPNHSNQGPLVVQVVPASERISDVSGGAFPSNSIPDESKIKTNTADSVPLLSENVKSLAAANNISEETLVAAIALKQQQLMNQQQQAKKVLTSTTTTPRTTEAVKKYPLAGPSRVMNAPREYYPVGYDKNFDDNFVSRVELPDTTFYCGEQKHFPGLYADEDLGCMVFHVCAFTDDGLIMKSFLCPESTLFDQSILKCNWWFYVDCKASHKLYDSNIPVSKSYQLMKALSFFSVYNKQQSVAANSDFGGGPNSEATLDRDRRPVYKGK